MAEHEDTPVATDEPIPANVTVEDAGPALKRLKIEIPAERIAEKLETGYAQLATDAVVPGFRPGRAPRRLLERRFGDSLRDESKAELLSEAYQHAVKEHDLDVIGEPDIKDVENLELPEEGSLELEIEVEVAPEVELPDFEDLTVNKPPAEVTDEDVDAEIDRIRERFGSMQELSEGAIAEGDFLSADATVYAGHDVGEDAEVLAEHPGANVLVPGESRDFRGHVAGIVVDDLGQRLIGTSPGDTITIETTGPAGHEVEQIKDQPITIEVAIRVLNRVEPATIETVLEQGGLDSEDELRSQIRESLEGRKAQEQQTSMRDQVRDYLAENVDLELPEGLTARQVDRVLSRRRMELAYQGLEPDELEQRIAEMREGSEAEARRELKLFFVLSKASRELEIEVSENEINGQIALMAQQRGERPEKVHQQMRESGDLESLQMEARELKTLDALLEKATVEEETGDESTGTGEGPDAGENEAPNQDDEA